MKGPVSMVYPIESLQKLNLETTVDRAGLRCCMPIGAKFQGPFAVQSAPQFQPYPLFTVLKPHFPTICLK